MSDFKLVIFDIDGTLTTTKSGATFRKSADDWQWIPGRLEQLQTLREQGTHTAYATNQGGIAYGYMQESDMFETLLQFGNEGQFDTGRVCYTHPKASIEAYRKDDTRRKPGPGMLLEIMQELETSPEQTLMVGDRPEDEQAAHAANCSFVWAKDYFGDEE